MAKSRNIPRSSRDWTARFARRLHDLFDQHRPGWTAPEIADLIRAAGLRAGSRETIDAWLAGRRLPQLKDLERIGKALRIDYRELLPEPLWKPKGTRKK